MFGNLEKLLHNADDDNPPNSQFYRINGNILKALSLPKDFQTHDDMKEQDLVDF